MFSRADPAAAHRAEPSRGSNSRSWLAVAKDYSEPNPRRSVLQLMSTTIPLAGIWLLMMLNLDYGIGYWATLLLAVPAAGLLVRLFMIQHDCGHGAFFRSRRLNDMLGRVLGVFTLTPYDQWRNAHAAHHASSGNLTRRGIGDIELLTVAEYRALPRWRRALYRAYRHPLVFLGIGPIWLFVIKHRYPFRTRPNGGRGWWSVLTTNLAIAALIGGAVWLFGPVQTLLVQVPITVLASAIGVWLFYVQHQFEKTYWEESEDWTFEEAALGGSSFYDLPAVLRWFSADIGLHHVHHLCSRIPNYRLREFVADHPALAGVTRITLWQSFKCLRLALWDEQCKRLVGFRSLKAG